MMYDNAVDQIKGLKIAKDAIELPFHLAKVTSIDANGRPLVQFYGDNAPSAKLYPYIEGYKPTVNDDVLMFRQGSTYIIAGRIAKDNITNNYYLMKGDADSTYLTEAQADEKYEPKGSTDEIHKISNGNSWFGYASSSQTTYLSGYADNQGTHLDLGRNDANARFGYGYFDGLGGNSDQKAIQTLNVKNINLYGNITPQGNKTLDIGTSSAKMKTIYVGTEYVEEPHIDKVYFGSSTRGLIWDNANTRLNLPTGTTFSIGSGTSNQLNNVYAKQFYQNGTAISTSDKRKKKGIKDIAKKYVDLFRKLRPRTFLFRDGESGRTHTGFIAQEVEEAAIECKIGSQELAFLCIGEDGSYGLRYDELIAIQTKVIQDLLDRVEALEDKVNGGGAK